MEFWINLIDRVGFSIAVCLYFMMVGNGTIKKNTEALIELKIAVEKINTKR